MTIQLNPQDIANGLLYLLGIAVGVLLVLVLVRLLRISKHVDEVLGGNKAALNTAIKDVPGIVDNVKNISSDAQEVTHAVRNGAVALNRAATSVGETVTGTAEAVRDQVEGILTLVQLIAQVVSAVRGKSRSA